MTSAAMPPEGRRSRFWLYLPFALLILFCIAWTGLWFYGRSRVISEMDTRLAVLAEQGRVFTCPERKVGGFPFRMELSCAQPAFSVVQPDGTVSGTLGRIVVNAKATDPTAIIAVFEGPLTLETPRGPATATWDEARISVRASGGSLGSFDVAAKGIKASFGPEGAQDDIALKRLEGHLRQRPDTAANGQATFDLVARLEGIASETQPLLSGAVPADAEVQMSATKVPLKPAPPQDAMLDAWRDSGGAITIVLARLTRANLSAEAKGEIKADAARKPDGRIEVGFANLDQLAQKLPFKVPNLVMPMLKKGKAAIVLSNGKARLGPFPLADLPPLY
jgi:hypothetical protein